MTTLTTTSGVLNLLTTSWFIRRMGVRFAMVMQTTAPTVRIICQTASELVGGRIAITVIQWTQLLTIFGGGAGMALCCNSFIAEIVAPEERTGCFGVIQGLTFMGTAIGYIAGGYLGDRFGLPAPFEAAFVMLVFSTFFSALFLPYIPPAKPSTDAESEKKGGFLSPLKVFMPQRLEGSVGRYMGLTLLGVGAFTGVLATASVPLLLQQTGMDEFGFRPTENGYLMATVSLVRAVFLTTLFPRIIKAGRRWYASSSARPEPDKLVGIPTSVEEMEPPVAPGEEGQEPPQPPPPTDEPHGSRFDLVLLKLSMLLDGVLTSLVFFVSEGWHLYVAAVILPFASGTAPACKGVMLEIVSEDQKADALSAMSLIETLAMVSTCASPCPLRGHLLILPLCSIAVRRALRLVQRARQRDRDVSRQWRDGHLCLPDPARRSPS